MINMMKMNLTPRLFCISRGLPAFITSHYFKLIYRSLNTFFFWQGYLVSVFFFSWPKLKLTFGKGESDFLHSRIDNWTLILTLPTS